VLAVDIGPSLTATLNREGLNFLFGGEDAVMQLIGLFF
jgi:hypothetical protein